MPEEPAHRVTITDIYRQGEDNRANLSVMATHIGVLLDRSDDRDKDVANLKSELDQVETKLDSRVSRLEKIVYWAGIPLAAVAAGTLGWDFITSLL